MERVMIEAGSEWFHRRTLAVVSVLSHLHALKVVHVEHVAFGDFVLPEAAFARDYARNEPVTLELLERMGWKRHEDVSSMVFRVSRNGFATLHHWYNAIGGWAIQLNDSSYSIPGPATLRDLLQTLRVFGVSCPIPEAANV